MQPITGTAPRVQAWSCTACATRWAITTVNPKPRPAYLADLGAAAEKIGQLRWTLRRVIALADDADGLTDEQLRTRLLALAGNARRCGSEDQ